MTSDNSAFLSKFKQLCFGFLFVFMAAAYAVYAAPDEAEVMDGDNWTAQELRQALEDAENSPGPDLNEAVVIDPRQQKEYVDEFGSHEPESENGSNKPMDDEGLPNHVADETTTKETPGRGLKLNGATLSPGWVIPFIGLILCIALLPLLAPELWRAHQGKISALWSLVFLGALVPAQGLTSSIYYSAQVLLGQFMPFIALIVALYSISGGIHLKGDLQGSPKTNTLLLAIGVALAGLAGTIGAALLLIRPLIRANKQREHKTHTMLFFIFLVANIGGSLTPLANPPLFLGFLKGVDFSWTFSKMLAPMLLNSGLLLTAYFLLDNWLYKKENIAPKAKQSDNMTLEGKLNLVLLPAVALLVLFSGHSSLQKPAITLFDTTMMTRGVLLQVVGLIFVTLISFKISPPDSSARTENDFSWFPVLQAGKIFAGLFLTLIPVIAIIRAGHEGSFAPLFQLLSRPEGPVNVAYFWTTGVFSALLNSAPSYLLLFSAAGANARELMGPLEHTLLAITMGSVFMGALTYLGNVANYMVKHIAEENHIKMPGFFGYLKWSLVALLPLLILNTFLFL